MRYALGIEYDGTDFYGFQTQRQEPTVQSVLERAIAKVADEAVTVLVCGRTDTGVHASGQVVHFNTRAARDARAWILGCNRHLPDSVALRWAMPVAEDFHARYSACARRYQYRIISQPYRPAIQGRFAAWVRYPLDVEAMRTAALSLLGEHDFTSFRTVACQGKSPIKTISDVQLREVEGGIEFDIQANAFLHHMVRNIVGTLIQIGRGERSTDSMSETLAARDRRCAGPTAPSNGLSLTRAMYPARFGLPAEHSV